MFDIAARHCLLRSAFAAVVLSMSGALVADDADNALKDTAFLSATTLDRQMRESVNRRIPVNLRIAAKCIAVFPSVVKAGLIVAAKHGNGLIACRQESGAWGAPAVFSVSAASVGIQAGIQTASYILLFMDERAVSDLFEPNLSFGTELSISAGPVGAAANYPNMPSVISYVRTAGLFAGVDLETAQIAFSKTANTTLYDEQASAENILFGDMEVPLELEPFHGALIHFAPEL
jgi:lipid-binding SYLF domain-containing protein